MTRTIFSLFIFSLSFFSSMAQEQKAKDYTIATYYFPAYHPDSINTKWHGTNWTEWELVKAAKPKFPGHHQPKVPTWGYFNEADPKWAAKEIDLAADNGVDVFIYDWYWYAKMGPYMHEALEQGFLKAPNRNRMKFALMWANHDWYNQMPATLEPTRIKLAEGAVSMALWDTISTYIVDKYFTQPTYWKIDGKPYFCIYEVTNFINGLGGIEPAKKAFQLLEDKAKKAGLPGVHFNMMDWNLNEGVVKSIVGANAPATGQQLMKDLKCESITPYNWQYAYVPEMYKDTSVAHPYERIVSFIPGHWREFSKQYPDAIYTPNVGMGFDPSPRAIQTEIYRIATYPFTPVFVNNTPENFKKALLEARKFLDEYNPKHKIVVLYAWNEWTEGGYLLPEKKYGTKYLEAIKEVFKK